MNRILLTANFHSFLKDKDVLVVFLPKDKDALIPISLCNNNLKKNIHLLSYGDVLQISARFAKSKGKFCKIEIEKIVFEQVTL